MSKQCLDVQQMQHLQEMGLKLDYNTMLSWIIDKRGKDKPLLCTSSDAVDYVDCSNYCIPAYTLHDVLDALPLQIEIPLHPERGKYELRIKRFIFDKRRVMHAVLYEKDDYIDWFVMHSYETLIDAAYEMLVWCIENGYVETKKSKQGNDMRHVQRERMV